MLKIDEKVEEALQFVSKYAYESSSWIIVKNEVLKFLPSEKRRLFSTRDERTKKQSINDFERNVMSRWKEITDVDLYLEKL